jgi:hypothetical protein
MKRGEKKPTLGNKTRTGISKTSNGWEEGQPLTEAEDSTEGMKRSECEKSTDAGGKRVKTLTWTESGIRRAMT